MTDGDESDEKVFHKLSQTEMDLASGLWLGALLQSLGRLTPISINGAKALVDLGKLEVIKQARDYDRQTLLVSYASSCVGAVKIFQTAADLLERLGGEEAVASLFDTLKAVVEATRIQADAHVAPRKEDMN